jgi:N-acetylneuraminate synthase
MMTCNHFALDFQSALELLLPFIAHLHVTDALGTNGEGVIMGTGIIEWSQAWQAIVLNERVGLIPEVWQGHKDHGAGFWLALEHLMLLQNGARHEQVCPKDRNWK